MSDSLQATSLCGSAYAATPKTSRIWLTSSAQGGGMASGFSLNSGSYISPSESTIPTASAAFDGNFTRKNFMNPHAPSYFPLNAGHESNYTCQPNLQNHHLRPLVQQHMVPPRDTSLRIDEDLKSQIQALQYELTMRDQTIQDLKDQLSVHKGSKMTPTAGSVKIPADSYQLYEMMNKRYKAQTKELRESKERLAAIITAIAMNPQRSNTFSGDYDEEDISHKIVTKLSVLQQENEALLKMVSSGDKRSLMVEVGLLRDELDALKGVQG